MECLILIIGLIVVLSVISKLGATSSRTLMVFSAVMAGLAAVIASMLCFLLIIGFVVDSFH